MRMNRRTSASILAIIVFLIWAAIPKLYAIDKNNRYFAYGLGQRTCDDYIKFREKRLDALERQYERYTKEELYEIVDKVTENWIAGFLTATDFYLDDTYKVAGTATMEDLKAQLETICRADSKRYFAAAMVTLVEQLNPRRLRAEAQK